MTRTLGRSAMFHQLHLNLLYQWNDQIEDDRVARSAAEISAKADSKKALVRVWSRGGTAFVVVDESHSEAARR